MHACPPHPQSGRTCLHLAVCKGNTEVVALLLGRGADADLSEHTSGWGPLHTAAHAGHGHIVALLLQFGASVEASDKVTLPTSTVCVGNGLCMQVCVRVQHPGETVWHLVLFSGGMLNACGGGRTACFGSGSFAKHVSL
eukprot:358287-Chlamydomonas_euryale.AAC.7